MFGHSAQLPIDLEFNLPVVTYNSLSQYQKQLCEQLQQSYNTVRQHTLREQKRHKDLYDQHTHGTMCNVGDRVWLHCPAVSKGHYRKFHRPWQGPFTIVKVISSTVYRIQSNQPPRKRLVVHYNHLKPYFPPFNKDLLGNSPVPMQSTPAHTSVQNHQQEENTDQQSDSAISETTPQIGPTEPTACQQNLAPTVSISPTPDPPLRWSSRRRQPSDRYGTVISYPDCYSSDSDT